MSNQNRFRSGDYKSVCDECGFVYYASQLRKRWDGMMVCEKDWESRHPQEQLRTRTEKTPAWTRPEGEDTFITVAEIDTEAL